MMKRFLAAIALLALTLTGCSKAAPTSQPAPTAAPAAMVNLTPEELLKQYKAGKQMLIVDVRTPEEFAEGHIPGAQLLPLQTIEKEIGKFKKDQELYLICRSGNRSAQAYAILQGMGYTKLHNVTGGMTAWTALGGPTER